MARYMKGVVGFFITKMHKRLFIMANYCRTDNDTTGLQCKWGWGGGKLLDIWLTHSVLLLVEYTLWVVVNLGVNAYSVINTRVIFSSQY